MVHRATKAISEIALMVYGSLFMRQAWMVHTARYKEKEMTQCTAANRASKEGNVALLSLSRMCPLSTDVSQKVKGRVSLKCTRCQMIC